MSEDALVEFIKRKSLVSFTPHTPSTTIKDINNVAIIFFTIVVITFMMFAKKYSPLKSGER